MAFLVEKVKDIMHELMLVAGIIDKGRLSEQSYSEIDKRIVSINSLFQEYYRKLSVLDITNEVAEAMDYCEHFFLALNSLKDSCEAKKCRTYPYTIEALKNWEYVLRITKKIGS